MNPFDDISKENISTDDLFDIIEPAPETDDMSFVQGEDYINDLESRASIGDDVNAENMDPTTFYDGTEAALDDNAAMPENVICTETDGSFSANGPQDFKTADGDITDDLVTIDNGTGEADPTANGFFEAGSDVNNQDINNSDVNNQDINNSDVNNSDVNNSDENNPDDNDAVRTDAYSESSKEDEEENDDADEYYEDEDDELYEPDENLMIVTEGTSITGSIGTDNSLLVLGTVNGDITCEGKLTISGKVVGNSFATDVFVNSPRVEGNIGCTGTLKISSGTVIIGDLSAGAAVIGGAVKGNLDINGPVILDSTSVIKGNIKAKSVQLINGAILEGFCSLEYSDSKLDSIFD